MMIKKYFFYVLLSMFYAVCAESRTTQEVFLQANQLYDEKQFDKACTAYQSLDPKDSVILYNMGNCYYKLGDHAQALYYWYQAEKQAQGSLLTHIYSNIAISRAIAGVTEDRDLFVFISEMLNSIAIVWFQLLFLFLLFALFFFIKNKNRGKKYRMFFGAFLLLATISSGIILVIKYQSLKQRRGIIMKSNVSMFAGPDEQYHVLASLPSASCIDIIQERQSWCKVRHNSVTGWIIKDSLTVV